MATDATSSTTSTPITYAGNDILRISGLASGIDTDTMISKLMAAEQIPLDQLKQQQQLIEWQRDDYRDMNTQILDYRNNKLFNYTLQGTFLAKKVDVTGDTDAVTATATGDAVASTMKLDVTSLATAASDYSNGSIVASGQTMDSSTTLKDLFDGGVLSDSSFTVDADGNYDTQTITINGKNITVDPNTESLDDVLADINKNTNVSAFYDSQTGQISVISKQTGLVNGDDGTDAEISYSGGFLTDTLHLDSTNSQAATDAVFSVNNMSTSRTSNSFTLNGVKITLNSAGTANLSVTSDTDSVVDSINSYITDYNNIIATLNDKIDEPRNRDYPPLTDAQKKQMSQTDIDNWTAEAKSGMLSNDTIIPEALSNLRMDTMTPVNTGNPNITTLSDIGITTSSDIYDHGKLILSDEDKLRAAIESDPDAVSALFTAAGSSSTTQATDGSYNQSNMGIAQRMYQDLQNTLNDITTKAGNPNLSSNTANDGSYIGQSLYDLGQQIDNMNDYLQQTEDRYYTEFSAMEQAISTLNQQSAYITSMFSS